MEYEKYDLALIYFNKKHERMFDGIRYFQIFQASILINIPKSKLTQMITYLGKIHQLWKM